MCEDGFGRERVRGMEGWGGVGRGRMEWGEEVPREGWSGVGSRGRGNSKE